LQALGFEVTFLPVQRDGLIDLSQLEKAIRPDTILVSVMAANNEIGVLQPLAEIGAICRQHQVLFHTDAAQAIAKIPLDVEAMKIDLMSLTAHKVYGPKGIGALYVRRRNPRVQLSPQLHGGGHERGMRSGTLYTPQIVGLPRR
jgi:cysteine desulfurase